MLTQNNKELPQPKVSVIINNYNYGRYVTAAIESARTQTYKNVEIVVVDDGSTDDSRDILARVSSDVAVVLRENGGQAAAFNTGFAVATGDLIAFLDSDDRLFPEAIESVVAQWSDQFSKLQFPLEIVDANGQATGLHMPRLPVTSGDLMDRVLMTGRYVSSPTSGNVFNRRFLEQVMPIPEAEWAKTADGYLNNCAPFFGTIGAIHNPLAYYRVHGQSMSSVIDNHGLLNVKVAQQLMANGLNEKALIEKLASDRGLESNPEIVTSHWMFLKLKLTLERTCARKPKERPIASNLIKTGWQMVRSVLRSPELGTAKKMQHIAWAVSVVILPWRLAQRSVRFAFESAPKPKLSHALRRW